MEAPVWLTLVTWAGPSLNLSASPSYNSSRSRLVGGPHAALRIPLRRLQRALHPHPDSHRARPRIDFLPEMRQHEYRAGLLLVLCRDHEKECLIQTGNGLPPSSRFLFPLRNLSNRAFPVVSSTQISHLETYPLSTFGQAPPRSLPPAAAPHRKTA